MEDIEERENGGTPPIIQTMRAALAFWVKEYINYEEIEKREQLYINKALKRLMPNPNIEILGNLSTKRQAILSFVIYSTTNVTKILSGSFVATLLNDLFGIQARGGCACAGPYGHDLLNINESQSLAVRSAIQEVKTFSTSQSNFIIFLRNKKLRI
jgi:selenocysteine lyase/cysteine desulfurase